MELRHLRYFVAVAEELHFRRAAERLHVAQPAVSEQLRKLEAELGVRLLDRTHRSVSLTVAGSAMLEEARRVLHQADIAVCAARDASEQQLGKLRIGYLVDTLPASVPRALAAFRDAMPGIEVLLESGPSLRLAADVRRGALDAAVIALPAPVRDLQVTSLGEEGAFVAVPAGDRLAEFESLDTEQLAERTLVLLARAQNPAFYDGVIASCRAAGIAPSLREVAEPHVGHALLSVASGAGVAVLPASAAQQANLAGVRLVPLESGPMTELAVISRDEESTTVRAFLTLAARSARNAAARRDRPALVAV